MNTLYIKALTILLVLASAFGLGHHMASKAAHAEMTAHLLADSRAQAHAEKAARDAEHKLAAANAAAGEQYEKGKRDAEAAGRRVADDLRAGNLRLRRMWSGCEARSVPNAGAGSGESDADAADRAESAGRIVRAAREADEQIKGLQDILRAERK